MRRRYFNEQSHNCLQHFLQDKLIEKRHEAIFAQITTHSRLLSNQHYRTIADLLEIPHDNVRLRHLQAFDTEQQFCNAIRSFLKIPDNKKDILMLLQCDSGHKCGNIIACARHLILGEFRDNADTISQRNGLTHVVFIIQLPRIAGGCFSGIEGGCWLNYHIDDLIPTHAVIPEIALLEDISVSQLFEKINNSTLSELDMNEWKRPDIDQVILDSIHGAGAMLKDIESRKHRKIERVKLLTKLLADAGNENQKFMEVLKVRITNLLSEKDTRGTTAMAQAWLGTDVASVETINKTGTLSRSFWQCLESKITPHLAGVVAFVDTNNNLDILMKGIEDEDTFVTQLWLSIISSNNCCPFSYRDLQSVTQKSDLKEFQVRSTGCEGSPFDAMFPFSWIIISHVDMLLFKAVATKQNSGKETEDLVNRLFNESPLGKVINYALTDEDQSNCLQKYIHDYVCTVYKPMSKDIPEQELKCIVYAIRSAAHEIQIRHHKRRKVDENSSPDYLTIPRIHMAFHQVKKRLQLIQQTINNWPECIQMLVNDLERKKRILNPEEMTLDVELLSIAMNDVKPSKKHFDSVTASDQWLAKMEILRPLFEVLLGEVSNDDLENPKYGEACKQKIAEMRPEWTNTRTVELFMKHVGPMRSVDREKQLTINGVRLSLSIRTKGDISKAALMEKVELFLKTSNKNACMTFFGANVECPSCRHDMSNPVELQCKHVVCLTCVKEMKSLKNYNCPKCLQPMEPSFEPTLMADKKEAIEMHNEYKKRCNAFFLDFVTTICFDGVTKTETAIIEKLMSHVVGERGERKDENVAWRTKNFTVFDDSIDPTPVVRSFILQLVIRQSIDVARYYLEEYLNNLKTLLTEKEDFTELVVLVCHCLESYYRSRASKMEANEMIIDAQNLLSQARKDLKANGLNMKKLEAIASTRYSLDEVAQYIHMKQTGIFAENQPQAEQLLREAKQLCTDGDFKWPRLYLVKLLCRKYGLNFLFDVFSNEEMQWVIPAEARNSEQNMVPDNYAIYGNEYSRLRVAFSDAVFAKDPTKMDEILEMARREPRKMGLIFLLVLHKEISLAQKKTVDVCDNIKKVAIRVLTYYREKTKFHQFDTAKQLIANEFGSTLECLNVTPNTNGKQQVLIDLAVHYSAMMASVAENAFLVPLKQIIDKPASMKNAYLPTMPESDTSEVFKFLMENVGRNDQMYRCKCSYLYVIGNCGRPSQVGKCPQCQAPIGGKGHVLLSGSSPITAEVDAKREVITKSNKESRIKIVEALQKDEIGHIIGDVEQRPAFSVPERKLSPASTSILRLVLHLSMLLGSKEQVQDVVQLIHPTVPPEDIGKFLMAHIHHDLEIIGKSIGHGADGTVSLIHVLIESLANDLTAVEPELVMDLDTKEAREQWEKRFVERYIAPVLTNADDLISGATNKMMSCDSQAAKCPLLISIYEMDVTEEETHTDSIQNASALWIFHPRITLEHLSHTFSEAFNTIKANKVEEYEKVKALYVVLDIFLHQEGRLRFLRFLPDILRLQRFLVQRFNRTIDRAEAATLTINSLLDGIENGLQREKVASCISSFATVWEFLRGVLGNSNVDGDQISAVYCEEKLDTQTTTLALLLPSRKGKGLCALAVSRYLIKLQNDFLEEYARINRLSLHTTVNASDASYSEIVAYHPDRDLLPLVLSNCNYSLEAGSEISIEYDFEGLAKQVEGKFIRGRPRLDPKCDTIVFREEYTNADAFQDLRSKIPQDTMSKKLKRQVQMDSTHLPDLCENLKNLDICIGFLVAVGGEADRPLVDFMSETLSMETGSLAKMARHCLLKHTENLWLVMLHEKAKLQESYGQEPFDDVEETYLEGVSEEMAYALSKILPGINLEYFLDQLFELLVLRLTIKQNMADDDYADYTNYPLNYTLHEYIEGKEGTEISALMDGRFPDDIMVKHAIATWKHALAVYRQMENTNQQ